MTAQLVPPLAQRDDPSPRRPVGHVTPLQRDVVAVVIRHVGDVCLLRRSSRVAHDRGLWPCVTGYVEADVARDQVAWLPRILRCFSPVPVQAQAS